MSDRDPKTGKFPPRPGKPASGVPAQGALYGASGAPSGAARLIPGAHTTGNLAAKAQRVEALVNRLEHLAFEAEHEAVQVNAAVAALKHLAPDANTEAQIGAAISRVPVKDEAAWEAEHGAETDLGAAAGTATRVN